MNISITGDGVVYCDDKITPLRFRPMATWMPVSLYTMNFNEKDKRCNGIVVIIRNAHDVPMDAVIATIKMYLSAHP